jgi:hypothetical protein
LHWQAAAGVVRLLLDTAARLARLKFKPNFLRRVFFSPAPALYRRIASLRNPAYKTAAPTKAHAVQG